jgi:hypothetical protein
MAEFTTEAAVRVRFQLTDPGAAPQDLVLAAIADAHARIAGLLANGVDTENPDVRLVLGETLLAGAGVLRGLASADASRQKSVRIGGQEIDTGGRSARLSELCADAEVDAWRILAPFLRPEPARAPGVVTDSIPVLG